MNDKSVHKRASDNQQSMTLDTNSCSGFPECTQSFLNMRRNKSRSCVDDVRRGSSYVILAKNPSASDDVSIRTRIKFRSLSDRNLIGTDSEDKLDISW